MPSASRRLTVPACGSWGCPALTDRADGLSGYLPEILLPGSRFEFGGAAARAGGIAELAGKVAEHFTE